MIRTETRAASAAPSVPGQIPGTMPGAMIETDPVAILARAMIELSAQGRTVNAEALGEATDLTEAEIEQSWRAARDRARTMIRQYPATMGAL
jgi:hypothetical protein